MPPAYRTSGILGFGLYFSIRFRSISLQGAGVKVDCQCSISTTHNELCSRSSELGVARVRDVVLAELDRFPIAAKNDTCIAGISSHQLLATTLALPEHHVGRSSIDFDIMHRIDTGTGSLLPAASRALEQTGPLAPHAAAPQLPWLRTWSHRGRARPWRPTCRPWAQAPAHTVCCA